MLNRVKICFSNSPKFTLIERKFSRYGRVEFFQLFSFRSVCRLNFSMWINKDCRWENLQSRRGYFQWKNIPSVCCIFLLFTCEEFPFVYHCVSAQCDNVMVLRWGRQKYEKKIVWEGKCAFQIAVIFQFMNEQFSYCHSISCHFSIFSNIFLAEKVNGELNIEGPKNSLKIALF